MPQINPDLLGSIRKFSLPLVHCYREQPLNLRIDPLAQAFGVNHAKARMFVLG